MRKSRALSLIFVAILFVAAPNVFAKVCHPKKLITCDAAQLSRPAVVTQTVAPAPKPAAEPAAAEPATKAETIESPVTTQQAMLCGPWVKWRCYAGYTLG